MTFLDIHAHILPAVDDGAKDMETALALLEMLKSQGVTDVIATPHFYPDTDNAEDFAELTQKAYNELKEEIKYKDLPNVYLGCELRYFSGMGKSRAIKQFVIKNTNYLLLELPYGAPVTKTVLQDIIDISERQGLVPILAHIERYNRVSGFKKLLKLIADGYALAHINAGAVVTKESVRLCDKLIKGGYVSFLASDTHSPQNRPPLLEAAFDTIGERLGRSAANRLKLKSVRLLEEIEGVYAK
ncbi:MAG: hypothetical protein IJE02_01535 [Clostridia bacterium]|nr:hypothetical protein [Clostridia bacterium]